MRWVLAALAVLVISAGGLPCGCRGGDGGPPGMTGAGGAGGLGGSGGSEPTSDGTAGADGDAPAGFTRADLLGALGACAASGAHSFRGKAEALSAAIAALQASPDEASVTAARAAFRQAMDTWQVMEMMQFGPTAPANVAGGRDLRDQIYAWPLFGRCAVEEVLVNGTYETPNFGTALLVNRRGLAALEYLLFYEGSDTECPASSPVRASWAALTQAQREERKRAYAAAAARDVLARAVLLDEAWDPAKANFVQTLATAGPGNPVYRTQQDGIQTVGLALFFLDRVVKDQKLTEPLDAGCTSAACLESRFAGLSKANIRANLDALRRILEGCEADHTGLAFDDLLVQIGAGAVADSLQKAALAAQAALDAIAAPDLDQALVSERASVVALRDAVSTITTIIKTTFFTVLNFEASVIPSDNDS